MSDQHTPTPRLDDEAQNRTNIERVDQYVQAAIACNYIRLAATPQRIREVAALMILKAGHDPSMPYRMSYTEIAALMDDPTFRAVMRACADRLELLVARERAAPWSYARIALAITAILALAIAIAWVAA